MDKNLEKPVVFACVVKWLSAQLAFDHGMRKKGYPQLRQLLDQYR
jgi:hypothetical protein